MLSFIDQVSSRSIACSLHSSSLFSLLHPSNSLVRLLGDVLVNDLVDNVASAGRDGGLGADGVGRTDGVGRGGLDSGGSSVTLTRGGDRAGLAGGGVGLHAGVDGGGESTGSGSIARAVSSSSSRGRSVSGSRGSSRGGGRCRSRSGGGDRGRRGGRRGSRCRCGGRGRGRRSSRRRRGGCLLLNHLDGPVDSRVGVELEVVEMLLNVVSTSADWVAGSAVGAEHRGPAVEAGEVGASARGGLLVSAIKNVVGLVGSVLDITPDEDGSDWRLG